MQTEALAVGRHSAGDENVSMYSFVGMTALVCSPSMMRLMEKVRRMASSNAAVLIAGETGSGKELVARAIHHYSLRCARGAHGGIPGDRGEIRMQPAGLWRGSR